MFALAYPFLWNSHRTVEAALTIRSRPTFVPVNSESMDVGVLVKISRSHLTTKALTSKPGAALVPPLAGARTVATELVALEAAAGSAAGRLAGEAAAQASARKPNRVPRRATLISAGI